ncbi:MAG: metallophosphoesterase [Fibrobacterota bacterium]|nr:metallophosphoesterase [Fibrobacterota bacterium]QQS05738.1 MAG: metallophosphoesterase [Fibrobacterota bacterium]
MLHNFIARLRSKFDLPLFAPRRICLLAIGLALAPLSAEPWKFAVLGDTQWPDTARIPVKNASGTVLKGADGKDSTVIVNADSLSGYMNPNMVPAYFLHQIHGRLADHGVRFVLAAGDLTDWPALRSMRTRATWTQELYDAGIGFFPVRGNHDEGPVAAAEFLRVFPQTKNGIMRNTPADAFVWTDSQNIHPRLANREKFTMGESFTSPACAPGRSYAFRDNGITFALIDNFMGVKAEPCAVSSQLPWLDSVLSARPQGSNAFVITHKPVIGACHVDNFFGDSPTSDSATTAKFFEILHRNRVEVFFAGHDHQMQQAMVEEPGPRALRIQQRILPGASYKFYPPLKVDEEQNVPRFGKKREILLAQDLGTVGYTVVEVDGPRIEYSDWGAPSGIQFGDLLVAPNLEGLWTLRRRWGASSRGRQTLLAQGDSLKTLSDSSAGTKVRILSGAWKASKGDFYNRPFSALASTDWRQIPGLASSAWTLWGLEKALGSQTTPTFAIAMSIDPSVPDSLLTAGQICLGRQDSISWKCVGSGTLRQGVWKSGDALGSRGVDPVRREVWAVVDRGGSYAALAEQTLAARPRPDVPGTILRSGRKLTFPGPLGLEDDVEIADASGRVLERGATRGRSWILGASIHGAIWVRSRHQGGWWSGEAGLYIP